MRARLASVLIAIALVASTGSTAKAQHDTWAKHWIRFDAPIPCSVTCAYWVDALNNEEAGIFFHACLAPFPPGSYDDVVVQAPLGADALVVEVYPFIEWDTFVCDEAGDAAVPPSFGELCDNAIEPNSWIPVGCKETIRLRVHEREIFTIRAFNWLDPLPLIGWYQFLDVE